MLIINQRRYWSALAIGLVGLLVSLGVWAVLPAHAQDEVSFVFEKIQVKKQSVGVRDAEGNDLGSGQFRAHVTNSRSDHTNGLVTITLDPLWDVRIDVTRVDEIIYDENGNPVGVALSGRGTLSRDGQTETFAATVTVRDGATSTIPDCLIWDIPGAPVIDGLNFDAGGQLEFQES